MKNVNLAGRSLSLDVTAWAAADRRFGSLVILGAMVLLVLAGTAVWYLALPEVFLWVLVVLAATLLVFEALIVVLGARAERAIADLPDLPEEDAHAHA
ncbi:MAG TPA: hypothetical protein VM889_07470, partial [Candidatus Thermoplasmatota archaeon]|nr:hypothetical protein [Candidatus Thermoplasmatota archaeon]